MTFGHQLPQQTSTPAATPQPSSRDPHRINEVTRAAARPAVVSVARILHAGAGRQPEVPGTSAAETGIGPLAGVGAARAMESACKSVTIDYIRAAREAGHNWTEIGLAIEWQLGPETRSAEADLAESAFRYANRDAPATARIYDHPFTWHCGTCDHIVGDYGLLYGPELDEEGHADDCARRAQAIATWNTEHQPPGPRLAEAEGETREIGWEAGQ